MLSRRWLDLSSNHIKSLAGSKITLSNCSTFTYSYYTITEGLVYRNVDTITECPEAGQIDIAVSQALRARVERQDPPLNTACSGCSPSDGLF